MVQDSGGGGGSSPFAAQTAANTNVDWPDSIDNVKADFASMTTYAKNMFNAGMDMLGSTGTFQNHMPQLATAGFFTMTGGATVMPEAALAHQFVSANQHDFLNMVADLQVSLQNIGYAAQTISDAYGLTDGSSAGDLNSITVDGVDFAFGRGGERPPGLDPSRGKTYQQMLAEQGGEAGAKTPTALNANDPSTLGGTQTVNTYGTPGYATTVRTVTYPDGSKIVITSFSTPAGYSTARYEVYDAANKVVSNTTKTTETRGNTTTVTTQTAGSKAYNVQTTTVADHPPNTSANSSTVVTNTSVDEHGNSTPGSSTTTTRYTDGSTTTSTTTPHGDKPATTTTLNVGDNDTDLGTVTDPKEYADQTYGVNRPSLT